MAAARVKKNSHGRRKIDMILIQDENNRLITFSKRRTGLFKKASELSTLCGAQIALIMFTACGKPYSFGHPNVDSVVDQFLNGHSVSLAHGVMLRQIRERCDEMNDELEEKRKSEKAIEEAVANLKGQYVEDQLSVLDLKKLEEAKDKLEEFKRRLEHPIKESHLGSCVGYSNSATADLSSVKMDGPIPTDWLKL